MKQSRDEQLIRRHGRVASYQGSEKERLLRAERHAFLVCILSIAGFPLSLIGIGFFMGAAALVIGIRTKRPNGTRPTGAKVGIVFSVLDIILGIPGLIVIYGTFINHDSEFIRNLVELIFKSQSLIL